MQLVEIPEGSRGSQAPMGRWEMLGNREGWGVRGFWPWGRTSVSSEEGEQVTEGQKSFFLA